MPNNKRNAGNTYIWNHPVDFVFRRPARMPSHIERTAADDAGETSNINEDEQETQTSNTEMDIQIIADRVYLLMQKDLRVERERRH